MNINISLIMGKTQQYVDSPYGHKKVAAARNIALRKGSTFGTITGTGEAFGSSQMELAAIKLVDILIANLPDSIRDSFRSDWDSIGGWYTQPYQSSDDCWEIDVIIPSSLLDRPSLTSYVEEGSKHYTGRGVDNIVALLNNGWSYPEERAPFGTWESKGAEIYAKHERRGGHFMQQAVTDFNGNYGSDFSCTAKLNTDIYK